MTPGADPLPRGARPPGAAVASGAPSQARLSLAQALCVLAMTLPWLNPFHAGPSPSVQPWLVSLACGAMLVAAAGLGRLPWALAAGSAAFAIFAAARGNGGLESYGAFGAVALTLACAGAGAALARRPEGLRAVALAWLLAAALSALIALWQYFGLATQPDGWISASLDGEAYANLRQRNQFASLTAIGLCAAAYLARQGWPLRLALPAMALLAVGNAATTSRTGLLQLALLAGLFAWLHRRQRRWLAVAALPVLAYAVASAALPLLAQATGLSHGASLFQRVAATGACSGRGVLWSNVLTLIGQRPWWGWGWGELDFAHYAHLYAGLRFCDILDNAHSLPLHLAVELGLAAALLSMGVAALGLARLARAARPTPAQTMAWAVIGLIALHSLLEYPLWYGPFQMALGLCLGILWAASREPRAGAPLLPRAAASGVALALAAGACAVAWDYERISQLYRPPGERGALWPDSLSPQAMASWPFRDHGRFAALTTSPTTASNAGWVLAESTALLHFSPEPRVIERAIESALLLGRNDEALATLARYRQAFPKDHAAWASKEGRP